MRFTTCTYLMNSKVACSPVVARISSDMNFMVTVTKILKCAGRCDYLHVGRYIGTSALVGLIK